MGSTRKDYDKYWRKESIERLDSTWSGQSADSVSVQLFSQTWLLVSPAILETLTVISTESSESSTAESDGNVSSPGHKSEYTS